MTNAINAAIFIGLLLALIALLPDFEHWDS
jgi:hypothetical protein